MLGLIRNAMIEKQFIVYNFTIQLVTTLCSFIYICITSQKCLCQKEKGIY